MSAFTLRQLEIFAQVVEHGSFRRCAERLGVSQVSISEHVRELEARLGVKLFERQVGGPATLTPEGVRAHRRVVAIMADVNDLAWEISGGRVGAGRKLAVGVHPYLMRYLQDTFAEFRRLHAKVDVRLDLDPAAPSVLLERVKNRELDLAYFFATDERDAPESELIRLEPLAIFVGNDHALAHAAVVTAADIRATPAVHLTPRNPLRPLVDRALEQAGVGGGPISLETDDYGLILTSLRQGRGFTCMFQAAETEVAQANGLKRLALEHPIPALQVRRLGRHSARYDESAYSLLDRLNSTLKAS